jgi:hypothetical protein
MLVWDEVRPKVPDEILNVTRVPHTTGVSQKTALPLTPLLLALSLTSHPPQFGPTKTPKVNETMSQPTWIAPIVSGRPTDNGGTKVDRKTVSGPFDPMFCAGMAERLWC